MSKGIIILLAVSTILGLIVGCQQGSQVIAHQNPTAWEYCTDTIPTTGRLIACPDADYLNRYGAQGWELADCIYQTYQNSNDTWSTAVVVIFKRPQ